MFKSDRIIALDIGASKVVLAEFSAPRAGSPVLEKYGIVRIGLEPEKEADASAYIVAGIRDIMREQGIRPAPLLMTVSGQAVFPRYVKLPPVSRDKILQIIQYEAEQNVPFPIEEVVWDYQLIGSQADEVNVMLVAVKVENVSRLTDCVQAVGLEPEIVDVAPLALYNVTRFNYPDVEGCTMILDIGARSSNLVFLEGERIFSRSIPVAGNAVTQELMKEFDVPFAEAEELKRTHAFVALGGVYGGGGNEVADRVSKVVRSVVTRMHAEVNRSINFYRSQQGGSPPARVLLAGGSSVIPHMDTFFREKLKVDVDYLNPFVNVAVGASVDTDRIGKEIHLLGEVAGLALRRSLACPVEINLMPPALVAKKVFRRRQPFLALAAAGLVLTMVCWWAYFYRMQAVLANRLQTVEQRIGTLKETDGRLKKVSAEMKVVQGKIDAIRDVVDLRTQWVEILNAIHSCMTEGMWITGIRPVVEEGRIADIEISGKGFVDKVKERRDVPVSVVEEFRNRIREQPPFTADSVIKRQPVVGPEDYAREFMIWARLKKPIAAPASSRGRAGSEGGGGR